MPDFVLQFSTNTNRILKLGTLYWGLWKWKILLEINLNPENLKEIVSKDSKVFEPTPFLSPKQTSNFFQNIHFYRLGYTFIIKALKLWTSMSKLKLQGVLFTYLNSSKGQGGLATVLLPHPIFCNFVSYSNSQNVHLKPILSLLKFLRWWNPSGRSRPKGVK